MHSLGYRANAVNVDVVCIIMVVAFKWKIEEIQELSLG